MQMYTSSEADAPGSTNMGTCRCESHPTWACRHVIECIPNLSSLLVVLPNGTLTLPRIILIHIYVDVRCLNVRGKIAIVGFMPDHQLPSRAFRTTKLSSPTTLGRTYIFQPTRFYVLYESVQRNMINWR